jgi:hypothetical protein
LEDGDPGKRSCLTEEQIESIIQHSLEQLPAKALATTTRFADFVWQDQAGSGPTSSAGLSAIGRPAWIGWSKSLFATVDKRDRTPPDKI